MAKQPQYEPEPGPEYVDEHHQRITEFANDYFDDDEEREAFVGTLMERRGYTRRAVWGPPDEADPEPPQQQQQAPRGGGRPAGGRQQRAPYFRK